MFIYHILTWIISNVCMTKCFFSVNFSSSIIINFAEHILKIRLLVGSQCIRICFMPRLRYHRNPQTYVDCHYKGTESQRKLIRFLTRHDYNHFVKNQAATSTEIYQLLLHFKEQHYTFVACVEKWQFCILFVTFACRYALRK